MENTTDFFNCLIELNISSERIEEFSKILPETLKEKDKLQQIHLNDCTPIYHEKNQPLNVHPIEELIDEYIESKEKSLELIISILKSFNSIIESDQQNLLCKTKIEKFIQFLFVNLVFIKTNFQHGYLFNTMKRILNYIQTKYQISSLFNHLELIILIREKQFNNMKNHLDQINNFFQNKQNQFELQIKLINYIENNRKPDLFHLYETHFKADIDINENEKVQEFLNNLYLEELIKSQMKLFLIKFHDYLKNLNTYNYNVLINNKKIFLEKLNFFLKEEKMKAKLNIDNLLRHKDQCENILYLLYKNLNINIDIQELNHIDTSEQVTVNDFMENIKILHDKSRLNEISSMNKNQPKTSNSNQINYNENICKILLTSQEINESNRMNIEKGYQVILRKEEHSFRIYFRHQLKYEIQNVILTTPENLIELLNNLKFEQDKILSKNEEKSIYALIYHEIELYNGFTKYSIEQIEIFEKFNEFLDEKLSILKKDLPDTIYKYIKDDIDFTLSSELPEYWSFKVYLILNNIDIITNTINKFPNNFELKTPNEIEKLMETNSNKTVILNQLIEKLFKMNKDTLFIDFYQCLSTFDKLTKNEFDQLYKDIYIEGKNDFEKEILNEIHLKYNHILKDSYFNKTIKAFDDKHDEIVETINSTQDELKEELKLFFNDYIYNCCIKLFNYVDNLFSQKLNKSDNSKRCKIYDELLKLIKDFNMNILSHNSLEDVMEKSILFFKYLENYCLILISEILDIDYNSIKNRIKDILEKLKRNYQDLEKCTIIIGSTGNSDDIILDQRSNNEIRLIYQTTITNKIECFILKKDDDEKLFTNLNQYNGDDRFIQEEIYSLVKSKNGLIYRNQYLFENEIFLKLFLEQIKEAPKQNLEEKIINSFEFIFQNSNINFETLILFYEGFQNFKQNLQIENQFELLIDEKYNDLINKMAVGFNKLIHHVEEKNRILNFVWKYLRKENVKFEKNQLIRMMLEIKTILTSHQLEIKDFLICSKQLSHSIIKRPLICLNEFEDQLKILQFKMRLFIINIDYSKDCQMKKIFEDFNSYLKGQKSIDNQRIYNLLNEILEHQDSFEPLHYESIMKKILLNFKMNNEKFDLEFLTNIENNIKKYEKSNLIKKDYLDFIIEKIKNQLISNYNEQLKTFEEKYKLLSNSIKEIVDLFWSNVSMSELLNKEREKTYFNVNIEKLLKISRREKETILSDILDKIKQIQSNSNKKQFTNDLHQYLNDRINTELLDNSYKIILPIELEQPIECIVYNDKDNENVLNKLSILFEKSIDKFNNQPEYNDFFRSFANVFQYFSWRLCEYESKEKQNIIDKSLDRFNASIKRFKNKIKNENLEEIQKQYNEFYRFEKLYKLRTNENQLQQELNSFQCENQEKLDIITKILELQLKQLANDQQSIISFAKDSFSMIDSIFSKDNTYLNGFYLKETNVKQDPSVEQRENITENIPQEEPKQLTDEEQKELKIDFKDKTFILDKILLNLASKEDSWDNKKDVIDTFNLAKKALTENYLKSIYKDCDEQSIEIKNLKDILIESDPNQWNEDIQNLSNHLFLTKLIQSYGFDFQILVKQYNKIEELTTENQIDANLYERWKDEIKDNNDLMETIDFIRRYSKTDLNKYELQTDLTRVIGKFISDMKLINEIKSSFDILQFFISSEQIENLIELLQRKLTDDSSIKFPKEKLSDLFGLLSKSDNFNRSLDLIDNFNKENWLLYLNVMKIKSNLNNLFDRYLDELDFNDLIVENSINLDELIEKEFHTIKIKYENSLKTILNSLKSIEINQNIGSNEKEIFFKFLRIQLSLELTKSSNNLINQQDLGKLFNRYLIEPNIIIKIIDSLNNESSDFNEHLFIEDIHSKSLNVLLPYLNRFWIIEQLELDNKVLENEAIQITEYLELIKTLYSEEKMFELIDLLKIKCQKLKIIPQIIIDLLSNISNNEWILNSDILKILEKECLTKLETEIEKYMKEKRSKERDIDELIKLMREDKNNLNYSIKEYLNSKTIFDDLVSLINKLDKEIDQEIDKPIREWTKEDIQTWSKEIKGSKLLSDRERVQNAIAVVSQAIYLFTREKFRLMDTQIIALWLFLNPDLNRKNIGCLAQISTGEGKSIIVAGLAAIKALSCHRVDIITSSNVLAIRDSEEFKPFFEMFNLQVSNNCDALCEQGDGQKSAEDIRKLRYYNEHGPVDIVYGECSCFERDILLTEFNKNDENLNIIGKRLSENSISSVIVDEVDSMLLDKANMVLYLSHNIDTLKSLERIFVSIWQAINQPTFDHINKSLLDDDLVELVADMMIQQIDNKTLEIPEYDSNNCDYIDMKLFVKRRMPVWVKSAFHVKDMILNDEYIITQDKLDKSSKSEIKITVMDKDTGTEQLSTRWSNGVHQFLQLKHTRRLTPESLKAVFISNMSFFKRYQHNIVGLTGSLGSSDEQNLLNKVYKLRFLELPRFKQELFRELNGSVHTTQDTWLEAIKNALDREIRLKLMSQDKRRAVLMICENVKSVLILKEYLANSYPNTKMYKSAYEKFEIDTLNPGDIIIATNLAGRGMNLGTSQNLENNGGLHVITTYLTTNIRIEMQAFGRTARNGNKGTGEYIIFTQYGLSIQQLKQWRNIQEKERLDSFLKYELPKIEIEEELLQGFNSKNDLSCIGFVKLYQTIETKLLNGFSRNIYGDEYIQYQLYSLKNRWAFWLDSMNESINMINVVGKKQIFDEFKTFQQSIEKDFEENNFKKLIIEPAEFIKLGKYYRDKEDWSRALLCYQCAGKDKFYSFANYYTSTCQQNIDYVKGIPSKREFKHNIFAVKSSIEKEMNFLNTAAQIAFEIGEKNRQMGCANYGNEYQKQVKEKLTIWNIFSSSITNALGSSIDPKDFTSIKYFCDEEKAKSLFEKLRKKEFIKPIRISKKIKDFELPSIFNNEQTKKKLLDYLKKKSQERQTSNGHLNELNLEIFKNDLKRMEVFLPHRNEFIKLLKEKGFIKSIGNQNQEPLFVFQNFIAEKLTKEQFPNEILILKENLFNCTKEFFNEKQFNGTQNEFIKEFNNFFKSKHSEIDLSERDLITFYKFLKQHSCFEKLDQFNVIKDKIINMNEGLKDSYLYANLYDFERHYTNEFKNFELVFRNNFLKIILVQKDIEIDGSYFTIQDKIDSNDFELPRNENDAIDYLWHYLKSNSFIKLPTVNIGLISSTEVKKKQEEIKKEIKLFFQNELSEAERNELDQAVESTFNIIDQTIGELKKIPDEKTIASYLQIKTDYFLNNKKIVPDALEEFIELALDVVFRLEEKKEPPKWYEIFAVIAFGVIQVVAGVLIKTFIPIVGQLLGEFLISTGCDDILFGVRCAMTGDFSWEKYWEHKKQSMMTSAITAAVFVGAGFVKNAKQLKSLKRAWDFQKVSHAKKLHVTASKLGKTANIGKYVGKEIGKTLLQTGLSEFASVGIEYMLNAVSNTYERELTDTIKKSVTEKWSTVEVEMREIFRLSEGNETALEIIEDCIQRKLKHLPEAIAFKNLLSRSGPVIQGLGKALSDLPGKQGKIIRAFTAYAPSLINLGINIGELSVMISGFMKNLADDLKDTRKKLSKIDKQYELSETQSNDFQQFQKNKIDQIAASLSDSFSEKLKSGIIAPVLNFVVNKIISKGIESIAKEDRIERLANKFELAHAVINPDDTKINYADELAIYVAEARAIDIKATNIDPKYVYPENLNGRNLQEVYRLYGDKVKVFLGKDGKTIYVQRPTMKEYYRSVRDDKPAGLHEQQKIQQVLECTIVKEEKIGTEQKCTLKRANGKNVSFVITENPDKTKHAEIIYNGQRISLNSSTGNKNDCYYNVALVANEMSQGKTYDEAVKILQDKNTVQNLRNDVSLSMKNDQKLLNEFRWTNRTNLKSHFDSLTGLCQNAETGKLEMSVDDVERFREWISRDKRKRPDKFNQQTNLDGTYEEGTFSVSLHHIVAWGTVVDMLKEDIKGLSDVQIKEKMENYLNHPNNQINKEFILNEMRFQTPNRDVTKHKPAKDEAILRQSIVWNPNLVVPGPPGAKRRFDPDHVDAQTQKSRLDEEIIPKTYERAFDKGIPKLDAFKLITEELSVNSRGRATWDRLPQSQGGKFIYKEDQTEIGDHPYLRFKAEDPNDKRKLNIKDGTLN